MNVNDIQEMVKGKRNEDAVTWKGLVAGFAGGIAGAIAMNIYESFADSPEEPPSLSPAVKATNSIRKLGNLPPLNLEDAQFTKEVGTYPFGALIGTGYGLLVENFPIAKKNQGLGLSTLVYSAVNQPVQPPMDLLNTFVSKDTFKPENRDLISLAVFGLTTEFVRRGIRHLLD